MADTVMTCPYGYALLIEQYAQIVWMYIPDKKGKNRDFFSAVPMILRPSIPVV